MKKEKVVIIGAGISGLYLAYLLETKYEITIVEARERIGGRIYSIEGHDMGPSWIWRHHQNMIDLVYKFGLELFFQYADGYALYDTQNKVERFIPQDVVPSARVEGSLFKLVEKIKNELTNTIIVLNEKIDSIIESNQNIIVQSKNRSYECDYVISTLPPRLALKLNITPKLPENLHLKMQNTQTWMGNSIKCVIEFEKSFWRDVELSGFAFSNIGPLGEIHDASTKTKAALFGFVNSHTSTKDIELFEQKVKEQLIRIFNIKQEAILNIYLVNWQEEQYTADTLDVQTGSTHPMYGIDTKNYSKKILFSSTEFSFSEGGYLEGAIVNATKIAQQLL